MSNDYQQLTTNNNNTAWQHNQHSTNKIMYPLLNLYIWNLLRVEKIRKIRFFSKYVLQTLITTGADFDYVIYGL